MTLLSLRKKIAERKAKWSNHPKGEYYAFTDAHLQELDWFEQELRVFEKELSLRLVELKKENIPEDTDVNILRNVRVDELSRLLGKKESRGVEKPTEYIPIDSLEQAQLDLTRKGFIVEVTRENNVIRLIATKEKGGEDNVRV